MTYLPEVERRWTEGERGLREMCDFGVARVKAGKADGLEFRIWGTEADYVKRYMAEKHPGVQYRMNWPSWK